MRKGLSFIFIGMSLLIFNIAMAQVPLAFTYNGRLEIDGTPQDDRFDMEFFMLNEDNVANEGNALWRKTFEGDQLIDGAIQINEGNFSVKLQIQVENIDEFVNNGNLHLGVKVKPMGAAEDQWVPLTPMKQLLAVPYAFVAARGHNFEAHGSTYTDFRDDNVALSVNDGIATMKMDGNDIGSTNTLYLQRRTLAGQTTVSNQLNVEGPLRALDYTTVGTSDVKEGIRINGRSISRERDANHSLYIDNGDEELRIDGDQLNSTHPLKLQQYGRRDTEVYGDLIAKGDIQVDGTINGFIRVGGAIGRTGAGTSDLTTEENSFCFLTRVIVNDVEADQDGGCHITGGPGNWDLTLYENGGATDTKCSARCIFW